MEKKVGIISWTAYVPYYRLSRDKISQAWDKPLIMAGEKAIANFDEDSITMGVAAALDCIDGLERSEIDGLYFASTTSPYREKQAASLIAAAIDLRANIFVADFANSIRAGTSALLAAIHAVKSGLARKVLVVASETRLGMPDSDLEQLFGDGAAALLIGDSKAAVTIEDNHSHSSEFTDLWRKDDDVFVKSWEDRFALTWGYSQDIQKAVVELMKKCHLNPKDFQKAIFYAPDPRSHAALARDLGFDPRSQIQDPLLNTIGNTGTASALMMLAATLEDAKPGDRLLLANYSNGADAFLLQVPPEIKTIGNKSSINQYIKSKRMLSSYEKYLKFRKIVEVEPPARPGAIAYVPAMWRERGVLLSFYGYKCRQCGTVQFPHPRVCEVCKARDNFEEVRLSDKKGKIYTYVSDSLAASVDPPTVVATIETEGGCRVYSAVTDCNPEEIKIGMVVEPTFRKIHEARGINNYFWKYKPVR